MKYDRYENSVKRVNKQLKLLRSYKNWNDMDRLNYLLLGIEPYTRYARMGMKKALKHAIKLLKEELQ